MTRPFVVCVLLAGLMPSAFDAVAREEAGDDFLRNDVAVIQKTRQGLESITTYMNGKPALFPPRSPSPQRVLSPVERQDVTDVWSRFLDYQLMLDATWQRYRAGPAGVDERQARDSFRVGYAAFLARYRYALDFIALADSDPALRVVLNEAIPELGLPARGYADFKFRFLNAAIATEFAALSAGNRLYGEDHGFVLARATREDERRIWEAGKGDGVLNTLRNAGQIAQDGTMRLVFPVQKEVSEWMGDTRVLYGNRYLVAADQIAALAPKLLPGDVLLERREWFLSNIGLPGFWPHAALYIGTPEERAAYFDDPSMHGWLAAEGAASFEALLKHRHAAAYEASQQGDEHANRYRVIEAMSEGVVFTALEHSAAADSVAVLRPRLPRSEVAKAVLKSFEYQGRPYDFDFDFRTDAALVCTELVYKAYGAASGKQGLDLPIRSVAGRPVLTANDIVRHFDENWGKPAQQFDLIAFFDGQANTERATEADVTRFRASWKRPKWHILTQNTPLAAP